MTPTEIVNVAALALFVLGLLSAVASTAWRIWVLWRAGHELPELIWRDLGVFGLLAATFLLIAVVRVFEWDVRGQLWWSLLTAGLALGSVWLYVWYEFRIIGHRRDRR